MQIDDNQSRLRFHFVEEHWSALENYDKTRDYKKLTKAIQGTKGVDFIGILRREDALLFIEATNYRNFARPSLQELADETAQKVRDTLAGIVSGARNSTHHIDHWRTHLDALRHERRRIHILLWFEQDEPQTPFAIQQKRNKRKENNLQGLLEEKLSWLTPTVKVVNHNNNPYSDSLTVEFL